MTFIEEHGLVRYGTRRRYPRRRSCDLCPLRCVACIAGFISICGRRVPCPMCARTRAGRSFVFDHCHRHGWIRGEVCESCNVRLGRAEGGSLPDDPVLRQYLGNCPPCRMALTGTCLLGCTDGLLWSGYLRRFVRCSTCGSRA